MSNDSKIEASPGQVILLKEEELFSYPYAGWTIDTPPPAITEMGSFILSPTPPIPLQEADGAWIPSQTVTPVNYLSRNLSALGFVSAQNSNYWTTKENGVFHPITLTLNMPSVPDATYSCPDVTMTLQMAACYPPPSNFSVEVNNQKVGTYDPTNTSVHSKSITLPGNILIIGANKIVISSSQSTVTGIWVQSITVSSAAIPIEASYQWLQICAGEIPSGTTFTQSQTITQGDTTSDSTTLSFGEEFGFSASVTMKALFVALSAQLSTSFSSSESKEHSVSITAETSTTWGPQIGPAPRGGLTYQAWQLCIAYQAKDRTIVQTLGVNGPIVVRQFPPDQP